MHHDMHGRERELSSTRTDLRFLRFYLFARVRQDLFEKDVIAGNIGRLIELILAAQSPIVLQPTHRCTRYGSHSRHGTDEATVSNRVATRSVAKDEE